MGSLESKVKNLLITTVMVSIPAFMYADDFKTEEERAAYKLQVEHINQKYRMSSDSIIPTNSQVLDEITDYTEKNPLFFPLTITLNAASNVAEKVEEVEHYRLPMTKKVEDDTNRKDSKTILTIPGLQEDLSPELNRLKPNEIMVTYTIPNAKIIPTIAKIVSLPFTYLSKIMPKKEK